MERIDLERFKSIPAYTPDMSKYAVKLDANESFIGADMPFRSRLAALVEGFDFNRYPDPEAGELCRVFGRVFDVDHKRITVGNGSDELIGIIITALLKPDQRLMVCDPDFSMYRFYAERAGIECVVYEKSADFEIDADDIVRAAREREADMVILSNPCNPTGRGIERIDILRMVKALSDRAVVIDEAYMDFWNQPVLDMAGELPNLIVLKTCSKALGLAALRVGFAVASRELTGIFKKSKSPYNVSAFSLAAAEMALNEPGYLAACVERILASRDKLYSGFKAIEEKWPDKIEILEGKTNFVAARSSKGAQIRQALSERGISVRFTEGLLRMTAGTDEENDALLNAAREVLKELEV